MPPHPDPQAHKFTSVKHADTYPAIASSNHQGHTVLITGASKGLGKAIVASFVKAGAANIIIAARSDLDEIEKEALAVSSHKPQILKLKLDISSESSVNDAVAAVEQKFGKLDILVNNAGYLEEWKKIADTDPQEWWKTWEVNLKGTYLVSRGFIPLMLRGGEKTIVNVSSVGAHISRPGASGYQTSKFALLRFTEFLAVEYDEQGLITFAIHPGSVPTELALGMPKSMHQVLTDTPELGGDTIAWLTQDRKEWLSGRYVSTTWDMPELMAKKDEIIEGDKLKMRIVI
jgi:NAD(P)-dependent dehydrogenase (short-subunit alcohol dehydrogenase family)